MKLPAYAKGLIAKRMAGQHPPRIQFIFGEDWTPIPTLGATPLLAILPGQYRPGTYDLRVVAGSIVFLDVRASTDDWLALAGEIADFALMVWFRCDRVLYRGDAAPRRTWETLDTYARAHWIESKHWPAWWPERLRWGAPCDGIRAA